jgi:hypothetical protein
LGFLCLSSWYHLPISCSLKLLTLFPTSFVPPQNLQFTCLKTSWWLLISYILRYMVSNTDQSSSGMFLMGLFCSSAPNLD